MKFYFIWLIFYLILWIAISYAEIVFGLRTLDNAYVKEVVNTAFGIIGGWLMRSLIAKEKDNA